MSSQEPLVSKEPIAAYGAGTYAAGICAVPVMPTDVIQAPQNLLLGNASDAVKLPYRRGLILGAVIAFKLALGAVAFSIQEQLLWKAPYVCVGPAVLIVLGMILLFQNESTVITFDKVRRVIRVDVRNLLTTLCCSASWESSFATPVRISVLPLTASRPDYWVQLDVSGHAVILQRVAQWQMASTANGNPDAPWRAYCASLGIATS